VRLYQNDANPQFAQFEYPSSDIRLKDNVKDIDPKLLEELFKRIRPISYDYKNGVKNQYGLSAQDLIKIIDDLGMNKDDIIDHDDEGFYTIKYNRLYRLATLALHDIYNRISELERRLSQ
jgi:hypothetical protein